MVNCILSRSFLSIAAITSDLKLTHMSFTDMWLWSDERNVSLNRARRYVCSFVKENLSRGLLNTFSLNDVLNIDYVIICLADRGIP